MAPEEHTGHEKHCQIGLLEATLPSLVRCAKFARPSLAESREGMIDRRILTRSAFRVSYIIDIPFVG